MGGDPPFAPFVGAPRQKLGGDLPFASFVGAPGRNWEGTASPKLATSASLLLLFIIIIIIYYYYYYYYLAAGPGSPGPMTPMQILHVRQCPASIPFHIRPFISGRSMLLLFHMRVWI